MFWNVLICKTFLDRLYKNVLAMGGRRRIKHFARFISHVTRSKTFLQNYFRKWAGPLASPRGGWATLIRVNPDISPNLKRNLMTPGG